MDAQISSVTHICIYVFIYMCTHVCVNVPFFSSPFLLSYVLFSLFSHPHDPKKKKKALPLLLTKRIGNKEKKKFIDGFFVPFSFSNTEYT